MPFNSKVSTSKKGENLSGSSQSSNIQLKVSNHPEAIIQRVRGNPQSLTHSDTIVLQRTIGNRAVCQLMKEIGIVNSKPVQKKENATGLPDGLKAGVESMSGLSMDSVRVHYNSSKPSDVGALAYTQGADIHVAPSQERHLPHEAWHVVQQAEGRVKPTLQMKGAAVNDDVGLEREADVMGGKAAKMPQQQKLDFETLIPTHRKLSRSNNALGTYPIQLVRKINGKTYNKLEKIKDKVFNESIKKLYEQFTEEKVKTCGNQLLVSGNDNFDSFEHFLIELVYDLETKLYEEKRLTIQERYMTSFGWSQAKKNKDFEVQEGKLKIYRTMPFTEWVSLTERYIEGKTEGDTEGDTNILGAHLGDFKQALKYFRGDKNGKEKEQKVMVEFTLKKGDEEKLFGTSLAFPKKKDRSPKLLEMADVICDGKKDVIFPECSKAEGTSSNAIGIKSESSGEAGFSIGIGRGKTPEKLFMDFVESMRVKPVGGKFFSGTTPAISDELALLNNNNCLINVISQKARGNMAKAEELTAIRNDMGNFDEMLVESEALINAIRTHLNIRNPISVVDKDNVVIQSYGGDGDTVVVKHRRGQAPA